MFYCLDDKQDKAKKKTRKKGYFQLILGIVKRSQLLNQKVTVTLSIPHRLRKSQRT